MTPSALISRLSRRGCLAARDRPGPRRKTSRPVVEPVEPRLLLSGYTYTKITDSSACFSQFGGQSAINNHGTVAFVAERADGGHGIYRGDGSGTLTIADTDGPFRTLGGYHQYSSPLAWTVAINDSGTVAFATNQGFVDSGIYTGDGVTITWIASGGGLHPVINNDGAVAFSEYDGVYVSQHGTLTKIADTPLFSHAPRPAIRSDGTVVFSINRSSPHISASLHAWDGESLTTVVDQGNFHNINPPLTNDSGTIIFSGSWVGTFNADFLSITEGELARLSGCRNTTR